MRQIQFLALFGCFACAGGAGSDGSKTPDASVIDAACTSISCSIGAESLCDDYTAATATQCADIPTACASRGGTVAKPAACPTADFKGKCSMPGAGGYVLRFYGTRGGASDESFCTATAMGVWSVNF